MELRHLRYFLAVADDLHFTRAAESLGVSQPTLSLQVKELERELGAPLFDRIGRSVRLTAVGVLFRQHAARVLREVEVGQGEVAELLGLRKGRLRVGVTHSFSAATIPRAVAGFRSLYPEVSVVVEKTTGRAVEQALIAGSVDLGIAYAPPEAVEILAERLFEEDVVLVTPAGHPFSGRARVKLAELDGLRLVLPSREFATRRLLDDRMREGRVRPDVVVEMNDIDSLLGVVRLGTGATVLSRRAVADLDGLALVEIAPPKMARTAALFWHRDTYRTPASRAFERVIKELTRER